MKKFLLTILIIIGVIFIFPKYTFSYQDCSSLQNSCLYWKSTTESTSYYNTNYSYYYNLYQSYCADYNNCLTEVQQQSQQMIQLNQQGLDYLQNLQYEDALKYFQQALDIVGNNTDPDYKIIQNNMVFCYNALGDVSVAKEDRNIASKYYNQTLKIDSKNIRALYRIGAINFEKENYKTALEYFKKAYKYNTNIDDIDILKRYVDVTEFRIKEIAAQKNGVNDDYYSYRGLPYLNLHNIIIAGSKVKTKESHEVIVAIIDDGIDINHPDLSNNIRINVKEIPNDGKDNDKNGYKDDYNGWNFVYNNNNLLPLGTHGTMIAGIIGAVRDNKEGIAGIMKNVKLMAIGVCTFGSGDEEGSCADKNIVKGINYAIDNGADIINLSLGGTQFNFTNEYNKVIERAYNKGIIVVIAAGNGDVLSNGEFGMNTDTQPQSPICNYGNNPKRIIGVAALDTDGMRAKWSNYGKCAPFYALGEGIFSTTRPEESTGSMKSVYNFGISSYNSYDFGNGTSFATPIVVGIIGLGFNKYGKVRPDLIWDAIKESMGTGDVIDANKYIDILGEKIQKNKDYRDLNTGITFQISEFRYDLKKKIYVFSQLFKKSESIIDSIKSSNL